MTKKLHRWKDIKRRGTPEREAAVQKRVEDASKRFEARMMTKRLGDMWMVGFATALAAVVQKYDQGSIAVGLMKSHGVTLQDLEDAGIASYDMKSLVEAWKR
jgi:hypothetical protein